MSTTIITGECLQCEAAPYRERLVDPTRSAIKAHQANREIWAKTHYEIHGHHRFEFSEASANEVSVAVIPNPDQMRISEDSEYCTMHVGGDDVE